MNVFRFSALLTLLLSAPLHADSKKEPKDSKEAESFKKQLGCEKLPQGNVSERMKLANCYYKMDADTKAIEVLREVTRKNPQQLDAYFLSSWLLWRMGMRSGGEVEEAKSLEALGELEKARLSNPTSWVVDREVGDFYFLRLNKAPKARVEYMKARENYDGDFSHGVPKASRGEKAAIEDRIGRVSEILEIKGEALEASCRSLFFDPDNSVAEARIKRLGNCLRKGVKNPNKDEKTEKKKAG